ncbi:TPA: MSHA biogenesis protein MshQ [Vibrio cholerae]|nr:MSHA biogenesis protein MshQ [Vibrio cholerae]GHZ38751.1 concanavalin A-like lectin/glucanases superfamily protein [Vibrio cholerae]HAS4285249.1 MSHA biogenesis protein MshQ [Vibrio cholerae]HAS4303695.1 MSHA biogenesis protein MshQ [Vibrio cholerae]HAS4318373.1 MSHA biogenesis protein MshQ [Vibrio cholerae]
MINYKWLIGLILFSSTVSAQQYNLSNNQYPPCNTSWQKSGNTYTCTGDGKVTLNNGDVIIANIESTLVANNGFELRGNVIGSQTNRINLQANYGHIQTVTTQTSTMYGNITATSSNIDLSYLSLFGNITSGGVITLNSGVVEGNVISLNKSVNINNVNFSGDIRGNDAVNITGGTYSGNITMSANNPVTFNSVTMTSGSISGSNRFNASNSTLGSLSNPISVTTNSNDITINNSTVYGSLTVNNPGGVVQVNNSSVTGSCLPRSNPLNACSPAPIAVYQLDEAQWNGQVGQVKNSVSDTLHGRAINGATTNNTAPALPVDLNNMGTCGYGVFIGNQNQYVDIPHNQQLSFSERLTVSAWVYPVSRPTGDGLHTIVAKDDNYEFHLDSQGRVYWYWATSNNNANSLRTTQSIPLNTWSHITIRYDRNLSGNQRQRIYINGVAVASNNDSRALRTNTLNLEIGRDFNFDSRSFNGRIDEVTIYGSALTDEQILSLYNQRHSCGGDIPQCFSDDFNRPNLEQDWVPFTSSGNFTPRVVSNRLRLTEAIGNQATAVTYQRIFPAANNLVQVELDYYAWANLTGNGADGVSLIFSDATVTPRTGGFGGSLGYAQRTDTNPNTPGFAGGWLGIGLDEWGNFANPTEGRVGGVGFRPQSITVRGSQASNYRYLTHQTVSPNIDTRNTNTPAPGDRYLIEIDSRNASQVLLSIRRTRNNSTTTILNQYSIPLNQQGAIPEEFFLSLAGSTGASVNNHEIDNFRVCALKSRPVGAQINHFRITLPQQALTCDVADVSVRACANSDCSNTFTDPVTAYLTPNSLPSATGGWVNGSTLTLNNGIGLTQLRRNEAGTVDVGVSGSNPTAVAFNNTQCSYNGSDFSANNCTVNFLDSGFIVDVPNAYANQTVTGTIKAVRKDNASQQCLPSFGNVQKSVAFWSEYLNPTANNSGFQSVTVGVNGTPIGQSANNATSISLNFNQNGEASFPISYREVGSLALHARFTGSGDEQDLLLEGQDSFIRVPKALVLSAKSFYDSDGKCAAADMSCNVFARADENFDLNIRAEAVVADPVDASDDLTIHNYQQQNIALQHTLVQPSAGQSGVLGVNEYTHLLGGTTTVAQKVSEVGVFDFSLVAPTHYLGLDLANANLPIAVTSTGSIGRFIPAYFSVSPMSNVTLDAACKTGNAFSYLGQPFEYSNSPGLYLQPKSANNADTQNYLIDPWWRYNNQWNGRTYSDSANGVNLGFDNLQTSPISRQALNNSGIVLNGERVWYQKPLQPKPVFNSAFDLTLNASNLTDQDGVCYRQNASSPCLGYTFSHIDGAMPLYWGKLVIQDVYGPETQALEQPIYVEHFTNNGFVRTIEDSCTALPAITGFTLQSDPNNNGYTVLTTGVAVPPQVLAEHSAANLNSGQRSIRFSAPGAGALGVIDSVLDLNAHNLLWLAEDKDGDGNFDQTTQGRAQFGLYRGSDRVIWWRESN